MKLINLSWIIIFTYILSFFIYARAEENRWKLYFTTSDGDEYYYDTISIDRSSKKISKTYKRGSRNYKRYIKAVFVKVRERIVLNKPDNKLKEVRILRQFDCSKKTVRTLMVEEFYKNGLHKIEGKIRPWDNIGLNPRLEALYGIICKS